MFNYKVKLRNLLSSVLKDSSQIKWNKEVNAQQVDYILAINEVYKKSSEVPGHIIELGTGKGRNAIIFGSILKRDSKQKIKHYFGFDSFTNYSAEDLERNENLSIETFNYDKNTHQELLSFIDKNSLSDQVTIIKGDFKNTIKNFIEKNSKYFTAKKLIISIIYVDCNGYHAAKDSLELLKPFLANGALIVADESKQGDETKALTDFAKENNQKVKSGIFGFNSHISCFIKWE